MSETATNIVEGFRTLRIFCHELAKMLRTRRWHDGRRRVDVGWNQGGRLYK